MPASSKKLWLGALLIVNLVAATAVVGIGLAAYRDAHRAAAEAEHLQAKELLAALRREVIATGELTGSACNQILGRLEPSGACFVALLGADGRPVVSAGRPAAAIGQLAPPAGAQVLVVRSGPGLRALQRAVPAAEARPGGGPCADLACTLRRALSEQTLLVEFSPQSTQALTSRAGTTVWVAAGAGLLLAGLALACWLRVRRALG